MDFKHFPKELDVYPIVTILIWLLQEFYDN